MLRNITKNAKNTRTMQPKERRIMWDYGGWGMLKCKGGQSSFLLRSRLIINTQETSVIIKHLLLNTYYTLLYMAYSKTNYILYDDYILHDYMCYIYTGFYNIQSWYPSCWVQFCLLKQYFLAIFKSKGSAERCSGLIQAFVWQRWLKRVSSSNISGL